MALKLHRAKENEDAGATAINETTSLDAADIVLPPYN